MSKKLSLRYLVGPCNDLVAHIFPTPIIGIVNEYLIWNYKKDRIIDTKMIEKLLCDVNKIQTVPSNKCILQWNCTNMINVLQSKRSVTLSEYLSEPKYLQVLQDLYSPFSDYISPFHEYCHDLVYFIATFDSNNENEKIVEEMVYRQPFLLLHQYINGKEALDFVYYEQDKWLPVLLRLAKKHNINIITDKFIEEFKVLDDTDKSDDHILQILEFMNLDDPDVQTVTHYAILTNFIFSVNLLDERCIQLNQKSLNQFSLVQKRKLLLNQLYKYPIAWNEIIKTEPILYNEIYYRVFNNKDFYSSEDFLNLNFSLLTCLCYYLAYVLFLFSLFFLH